MKHALRAARAAGIVHHLSLTILLASALLVGCIRVDVTEHCPDEHEWLEAPAEDDTIERWCQGPDGVAHGKYERVTADDQVLVSGWFEDGQAHGEWTGFGVDGNMLWTQHWHFGRACGLWITYFELSHTETEYPACGSPVDDPDDAPSVQFGWDGQACPDGGALESDPIDANLRFCVIDGKREGPAGRWFDAALAQKQEGGWYTDDARSGEWRIWYEGGGLREIGNYVGDERDGEWRNYAPEGWREAEGSYTAGVKTGTWIYYHGNGEKRREGAYADGLEQGLWRTYFPTGLLDEETTYAGGIRNGPYKRHHPTGGVFEEGAYTDDVRTGTWRTFADNGQRVSEGAYEGGARVGRWQTWTPDGALASEGTFVEGLEHGTWTYWSRLGGMRASHRGEVVWGLAQGIWVGTWEGGAPLDSVRYIDNYRQGDFESFWPNGQKFAEGVFLNGTEEFGWQYWYDNGQLAAEGSYHLGFKVTATWSYFTEDGQPTSEEVIF